MSKPTITTIAKAANVSPSTVSRVLNHDPRISSKTAAKVKKVAEQLGYRPHPLVSALMSHLRTTRPVKYQATIGYISTSWNPQITQKWDYEQKYRQGASQRAEELGYKLDSFWLHESGMTPERWIKLFRARGIRSLIIDYLPSQEDAVRRLSLDLSQFTVVTLGIKIKEPDLHFVSNDHHHTITTALSKVQAAGYQKIGLALKGYTDRVTEGKFSSPYFSYAQTIPKKQIIPPLITDEWNFSTFQNWYNCYHPEVVIWVDEGIYEWVQKMNLKVPQDVALVTLDSSGEHPNLTGVNQNNEIVGAVALELLIDQLNRNEYGIPKYTKTVSVEGQWISGKTLLPKN